MLHRGSVCLIRVDFYLKIKPFEHSELFANQFGSDQSAVPTFNLDVGEFALLDLFELLDGLLPPRPLPTAGTHPAKREVERRNQLQRVGAQIAQGAAAG